MMLKKRRKMLSRTAAAALRAAVSFGAGMLFSGGGSSGAAAFAGVALAGSVGLAQSAAVFCGMIVRSVLSGTVGKSIIPIAAAAVVVIARLFTEKSEAPAVSGAVTGGAVIACGSAVSAMIGELPQKLLYYAFYGILMGIAAFSGSHIRRDLSQCRLISFSGRQGLAYGAVFAVYTAALCPQTADTFIPGIIAGCAVTLLAAFFTGPAAGAVCGALALCGVFLGDTSHAQAAAMLPAAGFMTGYLSGKSRTLTAAVFTLTAVTLTVLSGSAENGVLILADSLCGGAVFLAVSGFYSDRYIDTGEQSGQELMEVISRRADFASDMIDTVRSESGRVAKAFASAESCPPIEDSVRQEVCAGCCREPVCWREEKRRTSRIFQQLRDTPAFAGELSGCLRKKQLRAGFVRHRRDRLNAQLMDIRSGQGRSLIDEQIGISGKLIRNAVRCGEMRRSEPVSRRLRDKLERCGVNVHDINSYYNAAGRLLIEMYFQDNAQTEPVSAPRLCDLASDELGIRLENGGAVSSGRETRVRLFEKPEAELEIFGAAMCAEDSKANGDTTSVFGDGTGISYIVLSDGMGTGKSASIESNLTVRIFRQLISGGLGLAEAIGIVNSLMLTKSRDEAFATLDVLMFDPDSMRLTVVKAGASATLICREGGVMKIASSAFPVGINEEAEYQTTELDSAAGDTIILSSDGVSENEYPFIKELLLGGGSLRSIVGEITAKAPVFDPAIHSDDATVIGVRVAVPEK